ncbi:MAG: alpha-galactosidase, partial [Bacteroidaceae bacterium]|nr:alpha-galactosidase [Bacteroidaceae bacterium]
VLIVRNAIALLGAGATGISYWQLFDEYYSKGDNYAQMQQLGMWKSVKADYASESYYDDIRSDYQPRPQYYAYSLLTRFIRPGAKVYPLNGNNIAKRYTKNAVLAAQNTDGTWIYVIANMEEDAQMELCLKNSKDKVTGKFERYLYREDELPTDDSMIPPCKDLAKSNKGKLTETIPANCVVLYRSLPRQKH